MKTNIKPLVCIIGAGVGGTITGLELLRTGKFRVLMLDVDKLESKFYQSVDDKLKLNNVGQNFNQSVIRGTGFGGGSNVWHGVISELDEEDWGKIDEHCKSRVSIEVKSACRDLAPYFAELHELFRERQSPDKPHTPDMESFYKLIHQSGRFRAKDFYIQNSPLRCRKLLMDAVKKNPDITIMEDCIALSCIPSDQDRRQVAAVLAHQKRQRTVVKADIYILSAGAIESSRILLQSKKEFGLPVKSSLVGSYLADHPWVVIGNIIAGQSGALKMRYSDVRASRHYRYRIGYRLSETAGNDGALNSCISFKPLFLGEYEQFKNTLKALISSRFSPGVFFALVRRHSLKNLLSSVLTLIAEKFALGVTVRRCMVFCYLEQSAYEDSRVTLSGEHDSSGRDIPLVNWKITGIELDSARKFQQRLAEVFRDEHGPEFRASDISLEDFTTGAHHAGTLRMGATPENGVVDANLKVFGLNNLFVADLSLFPYFGNANPTYTLCGFARRLAQHIEKTHAG